MYVNYFITFTYKTKSIYVCIQVSNFSSTSASKNFYFLYATHGCTQFVNPWISTTRPSLAQYTWDINVIISFGNHTYPNRAITNLRHSFSVCFFLLFIYLNCNCLKSRFSFNIIVRAFLYFNAVNSTRIKFLVKDLCCISHEVSCGM